MIANVLGFKTYTPPTFQVRVGLARKNRKSPFPISACFAKAVLKFADKSVMRAARRRIPCISINTPTPAIPSMIMRGGFRVDLNRSRQKAELITVEHAQDTAIGMR